MALRSFGGSLLEGFRPLLQATYVSPGFVRLADGRVIALDEAEVSGMASPGDYTAEYGFAMLFKPAEHKILGRYQMVETDDGKNIRDFADFYRQFLGLVWIGRASPYYNQKLNAWRISFHALPTTQLPPGESTIGLLKNEDELSQLHRQIMWSPISFGRNLKGQIILLPDISDQP